MLFMLLVGRMFSNGDLFEILVKRMKAGRAVNSGNDDSGLRDAI